MLTVFSVYVTNFHVTQHIFFSATEGYLSVRLAYFQSHWVKWVQEPGSGPNARFYNHKQDISQNTHIGTVRWFLLKGNNCGEHISSLSKTILIYETMHTKLCIMHFLYSKIRLQNIYLFFPKVLVERLSYSNKLFIYCRNQNKSNGNINS